MAKRTYRLPKSGPHERVGVAWFDEESYLRIWDVMNDPYAFPFNYDEWRKRTENFERNWKRRGHLTVRIVVDPDAFFAWCKAASREVNVYSLERFVHQAVSPSLYDGPEDYAD